MQKVHNNVNGVFIRPSGNYITFYNEIIIMCEIEK